MAIIGPGLLVAATGIGAGDLAGLNGQYKKLLQKLQEFLLPGLSDNSIW